MLYGPTTRDRSARQPSWMKTKAVQVITWTVPTRSAPYRSSVTRRTSQASGGMRNAQRTQPE